MEPIKQTILLYLVVVPALMVLGGFFLPPLFARLTQKRIKPVKTLTGEAFTVIHSGKDPSWHAPAFNADANAPFFIKPWLQAGNAPRFAPGGDGETMQVVWHTEDDSKAWHVEVDAQANSDGTPIDLNPSPTRPVFLPSKRAIAVSGVAAQVQYIATLTGLTPGKPFTYVVYADNVPVAHATPTARPGAGQPFTAMLFGDMGNGSRFQRRVAFEMAKENKHGAQLILSMGDVTYQNGRFSEYLSKFFAVYQPSVEGPDSGATLFDDVVVISCSGNHDVGWLDPGNHVNFDVYPDMLAYYQLWSLPLNGPDATVLGANQPPVVGHAPSAKAALEGVSDRFPRMSNYSYDYGAAHFLVLDANSHMDWTDAQLRKFVDDDLAAVAPGQWKIVVFHQPPFTSNINHQCEQRMRFLADIFERHGVTIVFNGHAHLFDRSKPLRFVARGGIARAAMDAAGYVPGTFTFDQNFDGVTHTVPDGVIYFVTGGGGAKLDSKILELDESLRQPTTAKLMANRHSFTVANFSAESLHIKQIDIEGRIVDEVTITR